MFPEHLKACKLSSSEPQPTVLCGKETKSSLVHAKVWLGSTSEVNRQLCGAGPLFYFNVGLGTEPTAPGLHRRCLCWLSHLIARLPLLDSMGITKSREEIIKAFSSQVWWLVIDTSTQEVGAGGS